MKPMAMAMTTTLEAAQYCISLLKESYPRFSSSQLASRVDISQSSFSRIENGQVNPSLATLTKLYSALSKDKYKYDLSELTQTLPTAVKESIEKNLSHNIDHPVAAGKMAEYIKDPHYRYIILFALSKSGTYREEIKNEYGVAGERKLDKLLDQKILCEAADGVIKTSISEKGGSFLTVDQYTLKEIIVDAINDYYRPEKFGRNENVLTGHVESVDKKKAVPLIRAVILEANKKIQKILKSPEYEGNDKVFVGMAADVLTQSLNSSEVMQ
ncbi:MAG: helix-turn-helix transcriptional regulator [Bacteriovoracales bacterium]|nr:helix-turn-helix transcriptional regulator [Bacteriovoracales bacterium]